MIELTEHDWKGCKLSQAETVVNIEELLRKVAEQAEEIKQLKTKKKFGLVWEDKPDAQVLRIRDEAPMLQEDTSRAVITDKDATNHILINGDNFHALTALRATHTGKIDVIYIDPPYNTGSTDFIYNDSYLDKEDGYRHSKWLSFMEKRLLLAKELLSDSGVIFVSIDDNEQARLKLLMDEVFGAENFLANIPRAIKMGSNKGTHFAPTIDYIVAYANKLSALPEFSIPVTEEYKKKFKYVDEHGRYFTDKGLYQSSLDSRPNQRYYIQAPDGSFCIPPGTVFPQEVNDAAKVRPLSNNDKVWRWSDVRYLTEIGNLIFKKTKNSPLLNEKGQQSIWNVYTKQYLDESIEGGTRPRNLFLEFPNAKGTSEVKSIGVGFSFPKPSSLISHLLRIVDRKDAVILDFFAGSGTTAHAVAELNKEDGGTRQCILVTDGGKTEVTGESSKNAKGETVNIAEEITYERVRRVLTGKDWADGKEHDPLGGNLRYFKVEMEPTPHGITELDQRLLLEKYTIDHAKIATNIFNEIASKNEFDDETLLELDYKVYADDAEARYLVGVNAHDYTLSELEEWFKSLPEIAIVIMVGKGLEEIDWVKKNSDRIKVDDVLGRVIRSRKYVAAKLPLA